MTGEKNGIGVMMHESAYTINSFEQSYLPEKLCVKSIGTDFRFEVPGQSSVGLIGGGRGQWLGGHHSECGSRAYNGGLGAEPPAGSRGTAPGHGVRGGKAP